MIIIRSCKELSELTKEAHFNRKCIGLVPTMGFLHDGHRSLIHTMRQHCDLLIVSDFVNPTQFGPNEDYAIYPKDEAADARLCESEGVDILFMPTPEEMYPNGQGSTWVEVQKLGEGLCGASRPGHFRGVATVVTKLFMLSRADKAAFGEKDYQQLTILRRMVSDLGIPTEIIPCPLVRETDGLALSSRNVRLSAEGRQQALCLSRGLRAARKAYQNGCRDVAQLTNAARSIIDATNGASVEYISIVDADDLHNFEQATNENAIMLMAVRIDGVRLIDNMKLFI